MIYLPPYIEEQRPRPELPKCPHCGEDLPGWTPPPLPDMKFWPGFLSWLSLLLILANVVAYFVGIKDNQAVCIWPTTAGSVLVPGYYLGCETSYWMSRSFRGWHSPSPDAAEGF